MIITIIIGAATLLVIGIISLTFWVKKDDWFPRKSQISIPLSAEGVSDTTATHADEHDDHHGESHSKWANVWRVLLMLFILVMIFNCAKCSFFWDSLKEEAGGNPTSTNRSKRVYKFPAPMGCVTVKAKKLGSIDFYPKGGEVKITPPPKAKPFVEPWLSKPGTSNDRGSLPLGDYEICGTDKDAWGIEVWN